MFFDLLANLSLDFYAIEYFWFMPMVETIHYTGHILLFGCILLFDARLLGLAPKLSISQLERLTVRFSILGFLIAIISGSVLLLTALDYFWGNPALVNKMIFMALALANIGLFHFFVAPKLQSYDSNAPTPWFAKLSAMTSLTLWIAVVASGRLIAYF
jgi:hypothetical protein